MTGGWKTVLAVLLLSVCPAVRLTAQCPDGTPPPCAGRPAVPAPAAGANSVAVMLFTNVTGDSAYAYLADGLAAEIATSLARVPRLEVRSPGAVRTAQRGHAPREGTYTRRHSTQRWPRMRPSAMPRRKRLCGRPVT